MSDHGEVVPNSEDEAANVNVAPGQPNIQDLYKLLQQSIQENTKFQLVVKDCEQRIERDDKKDRLHHG